MHAIVHAAHVQDRDGGVWLMAVLFARYPFLVKLYADGGYQGPQSLFECAISRIYTVSAVSALSLEQALAYKTGRPLLARSLWAGFRKPRRQSLFGQAIGIPHSNRLSVPTCDQKDPAAREP
jgi:hypothetical protein